MAVSPKAFPLRKRRPSAGAFISPKLTGINLLQSLLSLCREITSMKPPEFPLKRNSLAVIRKTKILAALFEELLQNPLSSSHSASLCLEEMYVVLQRIKALIEDCSVGSKMWLLVQIESLADNFQELTIDLSTLLDIILVKKAGLNEDVEELVCLLRKQCLESKALVDPRDADLRLQVLTMLDQIKDEIVPDDTKLSEIFSKLSISDSSSCREEIENLEDEVQNQTDQKSKADTIALIGLVRYTKCVLFGASTPDTVYRPMKSMTEMGIPADFRCPISLEMMKDPVVIATGQTYDRASISFWIESEHNTCPKTGQTLAHTNLIPNRALRNLIAMWCRHHRIPFDTTESGEGVNGTPTNKAAIEATRMTASFLVNKLSASQSPEAANGIVYELRVLAKTDSDSRGFIAEAGAIPLLVGFLNSKHPNLQVNAVTTILNLSILEANKRRIMEMEGALSGIVEVIHAGAMWEAKGNAAATVFSLSADHSYRRRIGRKTGLIKALLDLAEEGPGNSKRDAMMAILNLAADRETVGRLIEGGVMGTVRHLIDELPEEVVTILEVVVRRGGVPAVASSFNFMTKLSSLFRNGSDRTRESAAATLVNICRKGGSEAVAEVAAIPGIERLVMEVMGSGTPRGRRKAASLLRILRRWAAGLGGNSSSSIPDSSRTSMAVGNITP